MSGLSDWEDSFNGHVALVVKANGKTIYDSAEKLKERIEALTPIGDPSLWKWPASAGYTPGTLKASWEIEHKKLAATIYNLTPYAYRVETGWSYVQAPNGMMRIAVQEFPQILEKIAGQNKL